MYSSCILYVYQGCGESAFIFCGSGSRCSSQCRSGSSCFFMLIRIQLNKQFNKLHHEESWKRPNWVLKSRTPWTWHKFSYNYDQFPFIFSVISSNFSLPDPDDEWMRIRIYRPDVYVVVPVHVHVHCMLLLPHFVQMYFTYISKFAKAAGIYCTYRRRPPLESSCWLVPKHKQFLFSHNRRYHSHNMNFAKLALFSYFAV